MSKFNTSSVGTILLNEASIALKKEINKIEYINIDDIAFNPKNEQVSMDKIPELSENIKLIGLKQPLLVAPIKDGKHLLISGHRRLSAIKLLIEDGYEEYKTIPCIIEDFKNVNINISDDDKLSLAWTSTNTQSRKMTPQDLLIFAEEEARIYENIKAQDPEAYKGRKKSFVAEKLEISESHAQTLLNINKGLIDEAKDAFTHNKLPIVVAGVLAKLPAAEQKTFLNNFEDTTQITEKAAKEFSKAVSDKSKSAKSAVKQNVCELFDFLRFSVAYDLTQEIGDLLSNKTITGDDAELLDRTTVEIVNDLKKMLKVIK